MDNQFHSNYAFTSSRQTGYGGFELIEFRRRAVDQIGRPYRWWFLT